MLENFEELVPVYGPKIVGAALILMLGYLAARIVAAVVRRIVAKTDVDDILISFVGNIVYAGILALAIIASLSKLGVATTSFAAVIAAAGLAIGLALQDSLGNFAAGFMIIILRPFRSGDFIEAAGISGVVETISVFATTLRTADNKEVIVPNGAITGGNIVNYSARKRRRIDLVIGIGYDDDLKAAKELLEKLLAEDDRILKDPAATVAVMELADSSVNFAVRPWVATSDFWDVRCDFTERVKLEFDAAGISIPFPQQDVHVHQNVAA